MFVLEINTSNFGSTGNIALHICDACEKSDIDTAIAYAKSRSNMKKSVSNGLFIGNRFSRNLHLILSYISGFNGCFSLVSTIRFLSKLDRIPDIIHLHNLHNCYINIPYLFRYIKKHNIKVVWTLHDCWAFTGHCPHFTMNHCNKWVTGCTNCDCNKEYPASLFDNSKKMWKLKKKWFSNVNDMIVVTPSIWLKGLVEQSFLNQYRVKVINNGIDHSVFKITESEFRLKHNIKEDDFIVLGVAFDWNYRKGLDVFVELHERLPSNYRIVLVGTNDNTDKILPPDIISIHKTSDQKQLAAIYTAASVFVNPTREENFPTVNIEALACGTPVITFNTGGSPEIIDENSGTVVERNDVESLLSGIIRICEEKPFSSDHCVQRSRLFMQEDRFGEYKELFISMMGKD